MASLAGAVTTLGLLGLSQGQVFNSEYQTSPRPYTITFTQLGLNGTQAARHVDFSGKTEETTATLSVVDTASLSATEGPIDTNEIVTYDSANLSASEVASLLNHYGLTDTANLAISESIALNISGVNVLSTTDTASISVSESVALGITVGVTDTASLTLTESSTVTVTTEVLGVTDTASLSIADFAALNVFSGNAAFGASDDAAIRLTESAIVAQVIDTNIVAIKFVARTPSIRFRKL
jgi:hypothetical protein